MTVCLCAIQVHFAMSFFSSGTCRLIILQLLERANSVVRVYNILQRHQHQCIHEVVEWSFVLEIEHNGY
jgi:hypothetical protein